MKVDIFRLVANRADFQSSWLQSGIAYNAVTASADAAAVRKFLRLDEAAYDFFVVGVVQALLSCPALAHELGLDIMPASAFWNYRRPQFAMAQGMTLVADSSGPPVIRRVPAVWPFSLKVTFRVLSRSELRLVSGTEFSNVPAFLGADLVEVAWPSWTGLTGAIQLDNPAVWVTDYNDDITIEPASYPIAPVLAAMQKTSAWINLLQSAGLLAHYASATNDNNERLGLIALALARDTMARL